MILGINAWSIGACNRLVLERGISTNLQIKRLRTYRNWSIIVLLVLLAASPYLAKDMREFWPDVDSTLKSSRFAGARTRWRASSH